MLSPSRPARGEESGVGACGKGDAMRLLRAIADEQAHGRVGAIVFAFANARSAGLRLAAGHCEDAVVR